MSVDREPRSRPDYLSYLPPKEVARRSGLSLRFVRKACRAEAPFCQYDPVVKGKNGLQRRHDEGSSQQGTDVAIVQQALADGDDVVAFDF